MIDVGWRGRAACRGVDPAVFDAGAGLLDHYRTALDVCDRCPVVGACLDEALAMGDAWCVRGGKTPYELARLAGWSAGRRGFLPHLPRGSAKRECRHKTRCHRHGTYLAYVLDRCRCDQCRMAYTAWRLISAERAPRRGRGHECVC